jgi:light-regulated signal transduction histidine kinase (bacteriophytochrome)
VISNYSQLLKKRYYSELDEKANSYIDFVVEAAVRMQQLINDLLAYSRVETIGRRVGTVETQKVMAKVLANLRVMIKEAGAMVIVADLPKVMADESHIIQLFQNLISNAIKFRAPEILPVIKVSAEPDGAFYRFTVEDNGIGIDAKFLQKIFVIFQRLHHRETYAGSGIGLAICKKIVEQQSGAIWVESVPGSGSKFMFTLPAVSGEDNRYA